MPWETDRCTFKELWIILDARHETVKEQWEMTRAISFYVMRFGNSDPKKAPKSPQQMWKFPWDQKQGSAKYQEIFKRHALKKAQREQLTKNK